MLVSLIQGCIHLERTSPTSVGILHAMKTSSSAHHMTAMVGEISEEEMPNTRRISSLKARQGCCTHLIHQKDLCARAGTCSLQGIIIMSSTLLMQALRQSPAAHLSRSRCVERILQEHAAVQQTWTLITSFVEQ